MRPHFGLGALALVLTFVTPAIGEACTPTTSEPEFDVAGFYVDNDVCQPNCLFSIWIYQESNGIEGLQRGDEVVDDTCGGMIESDTVPCGLLPMALMTRRRSAHGSSSGNAVALGAVFVAAGTLAAIPTAEAC